MKSTSLNHLATYICKQNGVAVISTPAVEVPYADPVYKIIYLPERMANLNNPLNVGILLQQAGLLEYTPQIRGDVLIKKAAKVGLDEKTMVHLFDTLVTTCEVMRVEAKLIHRYLGAERYISEIYAQLKPDAKAHPAQHTTHAVAEDRFFPIDPAAYMQLPTPHQEFFDMLQAAIPEIEAQPHLLDLIQFLFTSGLMAKFLELWPPADNPPKSMINQMLQALGEALKAAGKDLAETRKQVDQKTLQQVVNNTGGDLIEGPADDNGIPAGGKGTDPDRKKQELDGEIRMELTKAVEPYIPGLIRTLKKIKTHGYTKTLIHQKKGQLNTKHLSRVFTSDENKVFKNKQRVTTNHKAAITLVIDHSGSMVNGTRMKQAISSAYLIASALERINRPVRITAFENYIDEIKGWNNKHWAEELTRLHPTGGNMDGDAVEEARKNIEHRGEEDKVIIVLTDGGVCQGHKLRPELEKARKKGIRVFGVAIGEGTIRETQGYYGEKFSYDAGQVENLPRVMSKLLKDADLL